MQVPLGLVTMMNPKTTTAAAINTCGSDFVDFTQANGRFIIPTGTTQPGPNFATANPTPAYSPTVMDIASHTHTLSSTFSIAGGDMCGGVGSTITFLLPGTYTITGPSSSSNLGLPYRVTKMCKSNVDLTDSSAPQLPEGALAYFATAACPAQNWTPADSKYTGRLIVSLPLNGINGQTFGSDTLLEVGSTGSAHLHSTWSGGEITLNSGPSVSEQAPRCADNVPIKRSVGVGSAASTLVAIPTVTVKLCRKTDESFTGQPTVPPTLTPTKTPTMPPTTTPTVPPTSVPTKTPTTMPTVTPTAAPATTPASTLAPNTQSTLLPTKPPTSAPTPAPGGTPITSAPTRVPNPAPAGVPPTVRTPTTSSPIPDGEAAAQTEDQVATIVGATLGGIAFILAAALFIRRGSFNQHAKPRHLASKASKNKDVFAMTTAGWRLWTTSRGTRRSPRPKHRRRCASRYARYTPSAGMGLRSLM
ncbi:hypothetical protein BASA81_000997 [Batrachochytrium salamandrivorans]|nr:hypothetical protein BASA81_000997 [Batrachochytrium salamandrivorans]